LTTISVRLRAQKFRSRTLIYVWLLALYRLTV